MPSGVLTTKPIGSEKKDSNPRVEFYARCKQEAKHADKDFQRKYEEGLNAMFIFVCLAELTFGGDRPIFSLRQLLGSFSISKMISNQTSTRRRLLSSAFLSTRRTVPLSAAKHPLFRPRMSPITTPLSAKPSFTPALHLAPRRFPRHVWKTMVKPLRQGQSQRFRNRRKPESPAQT